MQRPQIAPPEEELELTMAWLLNRCHQSEADLAAAIKSTMRMPPEYLFIPPCTASQAEGFE